DWTRTCRLFFVGATQEAMTIERAELDGDVNIDHPQIKGRSDALELAFAPTTAPAPAQPSATAHQTTRPAVTLRDLTATSAVHYVLTDSQQKQSTIDCTRLVVATAESDDKKLYPKSIDAEGGVHAYDEQQDL